MQFRPATVLILASLLIVMMSCRQHPWECPEDDDQCEAIRSSIVLANLLRTTLPAPGASESQCAAGSGSAEPVSYLRVGTVAPAASCYYRFEIFFEPGNNGPFRPAFRLIPENGSADLYVGFDNDASGGTIAYTACSATTAGGGWVRCSRNAGTAEENVSLAPETIPAMAPGDFRIVAVYNPGPVVSNFALLAFKNGL